MHKRVALKKPIKILFILLLVIIGMFISLAILINVTPVQNFIVHQVSHRLSKQLHTEVQVDHVDFKLFNRFELEGTYVEDQKGDTLLYAGKVDISITNFFFLRDHSQLSHLGMKNVTVNLKRPKEDSTWNSQFLIDAFSNPNKPKSGLPNISLKRVHLENIHLNQIDQWKKKEMHISAKDITIRTKAMSLPDHRIHVSDIVLEHPLFIQIKNKEKIDSLRKNDLYPSDLTSIIDTTGLQWNTQHWDVHIDKIHLHNGAFIIAKKQHFPLEQYFDPDYIAFHDIDGTLKDTRLEKDSVISRVDITAKGRGGLVVKKLKGRYKMSPVTIEVSDLDLETNNSHIKNFFALQFDHFDDLADFTTKVTMVGDFKDAFVTSGDIGFFAPTLKDWNKDVTITGLVSGTLDNLSSKNIHLASGVSTTLDGNFIMTGLPDIYNTFIDFQIENLRTNGWDLRHFLPALGENEAFNLNAFHSIRYHGSYSGFIFDFVSYGTFRTNLGNLHTDINFKFGPQHTPPVYSGKISSSGFQLGTLLHQKNLGKTAFNTQVKGRGLSLENISTSLDGEVGLLEFKNYPYHNIQVDGTLKQKFFQGKVAVSDTNLTLNFKGDIDFNADTPTYNFIAAIQKSHLQALNLTKDSITFSGKLNMNLRGNNLDNFLGDARLYDIDLYKSGKRIALDTLVINSSTDKKHQDKWLTVRGNGFSGYLHGQYKISQLSDIGLQFLHYYFPSKMKAPKNKRTKSRLEFAFTFGNMDSVLHTFSPNITHFNGGNLKGKINTLKDSFNLRLSINQVGYKRYTYNDIRVHAVGSRQDLTTKTIIGQTYLQDSLLLPITKINTHSHQDTSLFSLKTSGNIALNKADLKLKLILLKDGFYAKFLKSSLSLNDKEWIIAPDNEIRIQQNDITIHDFKIAHKNQLITLTSTDAKNDDNTFLVHLKDLNINDFTRLFVPDIFLEGVVNGKFSISNPLDTMRIAGDLKATHFRINKDSIGTFTASAGYNKEKDLLQWDLQKTDNPEKNFSIKGMTGIGKNKKLKGNFDLNHTNIAFLNRYVKGYVSNLTGNMTGELTLGGDRNHPELIGDVKLNDVHFLVDYTQVKYTLNNETIHFSPNEIKLGSVVLKDTVGRIGIINGTISHHHFKDIFFDINFNTQGIQLIHTTLADNPIYYGNVVGSGRIDFTGPIKNMKMVINASPLQGTHIYLPLTDEKDIGDHDFIVFKKYGKALVPPQNLNKANLSVKLFADMNPNAQMNVIVDPLSGDHITARGNGALQINVNLEGGFSMYGNYSITQGKYVFSFRGLLTREFVIDRGSAISWNGNPFNANINITAIYHVPGGANLYNLIAGDAAAMAGLTQEDKRLLRQRENIDVFLSLKNSLLHPDISYDIRIPDASISASSLAMTKLQEIRQHPNTLINQVAGLLAAGQFIPITSGNASTNILRSSGISSAGQWVSSQLTGVLNNLLENQLNDLGLSFNLDYNTYSATGNQGDIFRNDVQLNFSKNLFNNRIQLKVGPSINWGRTSTSNTTNNSYFAGDFRLEYLMNPSGQLRFLAFSRSNYNILLDHNLTRAGIGISYRHQFNKIKDLFMSKKEKAKHDSIQKANFEKFLENNSNEEKTPSDTTKPSSTIPKAQSARKEDSVMEKN